MLLSKEFDKAKWFCLWNSDQNCITNVYQVVYGVMRVQRLVGFNGVGLLCKNDPLHNVTT